LFRPVPVPDDVHDFLAEAYREEIQKLGTMLKRDLSEWLKN